MTKAFVCGECFRAAFITQEGITHHGVADEIDHDLDADHVAFDVDECGHANDGPESLLMRWQVANDAFDHFDFGSSQVVSAEGWEGVTPGTEFTRTIYLSTDNAATQRARFTVRFRDIASAEIVEAYVITEKSPLFGASEKPH